ncbi:hypothetical protein [Amycolatopsis jejuensis]|uniref:hypothetical protein n=1 Tax=Amycolatopsis jejuensis TaxID=330084 RepID=UPI0005253A6B|nr:hypothetical protein [Amycolatopsis jejuensis]
MSVIALTAVVWLGCSAPRGTHPSFQFGLIFVGGPAICLLFCGIIVSQAKERMSSFPSVDREFRAVVRRGIRRGWLFALAIAVCGTGFLLVVPNALGRTPVSAGTLAIAIAVAMATCAGVTAGIVLRAVPKE